MKVKIYPYIYKAWTRNGFKQLCLIPTIYITHSKRGHFIETGVETDVWVISMNFLVWDFGVQIYKDII